MQNLFINRACSRIGKTVLHLDENEYYGGEWTSFNFTPFLNYLKDQQLKGIKIKPVFNLIFFTKKKKLD